MDDRKVVFISYWTPPYQKAAMRLKASLDKLGLASDINEIPDKGWQANVRHKPTYILEMLRKHEDAYAVVWIDADGDVVQKPELFWQIEDDLAVRFLHWQAKDVDELLSGTVFARRTDNMLKAMEAWIKELAVAPQNLSCPEQRTLQNMLPTLPITVNRLPEPYCRILKDRGRHGVPADSVIVHYQFSREVRYGRTPAAHLSGPTKVGNTRIAVANAPHKASRVEIRKQQHASLKAKIRPKKNPPATTKPRVADSIAASLRRRRIFAMRNQIVKRDSDKKVNNDAIRVMAEMIRAKKMGKMLTGSNLPSPSRACAGGVKGHPCSPQQNREARARMATMPQASELDGMLSYYNDCIVMGNSPTIKTIPVELLNRIPTVGCNRALKYKEYWPDFLVIADREPYCQERDAGRLEAAAAAGTRLLLSDSLFDPTIELRGPYSNEQRRAQQTPDFHAYLYKIGPRKKSWNYQDVLDGRCSLPINTSCFDWPVVSCLNVAGSMLQTAMILGAKRIACIGIEFKWANAATSHFFGCGSDVGAYAQDGAVELILGAMRQIKRAAKDAGIEIINLSPVKDSPFSSVFGSYPLSKYIEESSEFPVWSRKNPKLEVSEIADEQEVISAIYREAELKQGINKGTAPGSGKHVDLPNLSGETQEAE